MFQKPLFDPDFPGLDPDVFVDEAEVNDLVSH